MSTNYYSKPADAELLALRGLGELIYGLDKRKRPKKYLSLSYWRVLRACLCYREEKSKVTRWTLGEMYLGYPLSPDSIRDKMATVSLIRQLKHDLRDVLGAPWGATRHGKYCYWYIAGNAEEEKEKVIEWNSVNALGNCKSLAGPYVGSMVERSNEPTTDGWARLSNYPVGRYEELESGVSELCVFLSRYPGASQFCDGLKEVLSRDRKIAERIRAGREPLSATKRIPDAGPPIAELGFSTRTTHRLLEAGCLVANDVVQLDVDWFSSRISVGRMAVLEVIAFQEKAKGSPQRLS